MTRPFYWSLRRELWENRSLYVAPLAIAVFLFFGYVVSAIGLPERRRVVLMGDESKRHSAIVMPYDVVAMMLIFTTWIVGAWYCMDALHGERRDRSILFWKSLPVSDATTVLSKAAVPLLVLPAMIFVVILATQILMLAWTSLLLVMSGMSPASTFVYVNLFQESLILLYGLLVLALWHAPVYAWMLLLSAWARRATLLWLVLPPAMIAMFERLAFGSRDFGNWIGWRLIGGTSLSFNFRRPMAQVDSLSDLTPLRFLATPGLWLGLLFAGAFVVIAARVRRQRDPN
jgi:ABC-2 type transport system permease protein